MHLFRVKALAKSWVLILILCLTAFTSGVVVHHLLHQPWLGLIFDKIDSSGNELKVAKIYPESPASEHFTPGQSITAVASVHDPGHQVQVNSLLLKPLLDFPTIKEYQHHLQVQKDVYRVFQEDKVKITLSNRESLTLTPDKTRPWYSIPWIYKIFLVTNYLGIVLGVTLWIRGKHQSTGMFILLMGIAYYIMTTSAILMMREIAVMSPYIDIFPVILNLSISIFGLSLLIILNHYPNPLFSPPYIVIFCSVILLLWANASFSWTNLPIHTNYMHIFLMFPVAIMLSYKQWIASKDTALNRATCLAFLWPVLVFAIPATGLFIIPVIFDSTPLIDTDVAKLLLGSVFIGFTISILKYRLFDMERWWFKTWLWLISAILIAVLDFFLIFALSINHVTALGVSVIVIGFFYFPLRQWLFERILPTSEKPVQDYIPQFMRTINENIGAEGFEQSWSKVLKDRYKPVNMEYIPKTSHVCLIDNGLTLQVPGHFQEGHYQLTGKDGGLRLFNEKDCSDIKSLQQLMMLIDQTSRKHHALRLKERKTIMRDLHDTVGANLLTLAHRQPNSEQADYIHATLQTLRDTIQLSTSEEKITLTQQLEHWRCEASERCDLADINFHWKVIQADTTTLSVIQTVTLNQVLREALTNAIKHAQPSLIDVHVQIEKSGLKMTIANDGNIAEKSEWREGMGLRNMRSRMEKLQGNIEINTNIPQGKIYLIVVLPLHQSISSGKRSG